MGLTHKISRIFWISDSVIAPIHSNLWTNEYLPGHLPNDTAEGLNSANIFISWQQKNIKIQPDFPGKDLSPHWQVSKVDGLAFYPPQSLFSIFAIEWSLKFTYLVDYDFVIKFELISLEAVL